MRSRSGTINEIGIKLKLRRVCTGEFDGDRWWIWNGLKEMRVKTEGKNLDGKKKKRKKIKPEQILVTVDY